MPFEIERFLSPEEVEARIGLKYLATKHHVLNRGIAPDDFLDQLVAWGRQAPDGIFAPDPVAVEEFEGLPLL